MIHRKMFAAFIVCLLAASVAATVLGQATVEVYGHVYDTNTEQPIGDANFAIENQDTSQDWYIFTQGDGSFTIDLPPGDYHVEVQAEGYQDWETDTSVNSGDDYSRNIALTPISNNNNDDIEDGIDGGDEPNMEDFLPFNMDEDMIKTMAMVAVTLVVLFLICFITITITLVAMFVRLGKVRKELTALNEAQKQRPPVAPQPPVQSQYQQPPPPPPPR